MEDIDGGRRRLTQGPSTRSASPLFARDDRDLGVALKKQVLRCARDDRGLEGLLVVMEINIPTLVRKVRELGWGTQADFL